MAHKKIKTAIIGVGHLGSFHVEQLLQIPEAELVGVYDIDPQRLAHVQREYNVIAFKTLDQTLTTAEAVTIVAPTKEHFDIAAQALRAGCHVFIEKPITSTLEDADQLLRLAESEGRLIQVGHIERLNPAGRVLDKYAVQPRFIEGHRLTPFSSRGTDVPVVLDLMIHDIDMVMHLIKSPVREVRANGVKVITDSPDIATARLEFENGAVANLTASRISQKKMRKLRLFQSSMYISIDLLQQLTEVYRLVGPDVETPEALLNIPLDHDGRKRIISYEKPDIQKYNALHLELSNFIRSAAGLEKPVVDGYSARAALDVAIRVQEAIARTDNEPQEPIQEGQ